MQISDNLKIDGCILLTPFVSSDPRGSFVKIFSSDEASTLPVEGSVREAYYTISKKNVIRGMHFQVPPHAHSKYVHCIEGEILDVVLDIRSSSPTFGQWDVTLLSSTNRYQLYIPPGIAHGFRTLSEKAIVLYMTSSVYNREADLGIRWDSFGFHWACSSPILSDRDRAFPALSEFSTPF